MRKSGLAFARVALVRSVMPVGLGLILLSIGGCEDKGGTDKPIFKPTVVDPASIFDKKLGPIPILPSDNPLTLEGIALGRMLFYDPILSIDSSISCGSCHKQQYAFADGPVALSRGVFGLATHRNTPPIFNLAYNKKFFLGCAAEHVEGIGFRTHSGAQRDGHDLAFVGPAFTQVYFV